MSLLCATVLLLANVGFAWYIPMVSPVGYSPGDVLPIKVNSLTSTQGVMPYSFYTFKTCQPTPERLKKERKVENLGEILWGDRIEPSEYTVEVLRNVSCRPLCKPLSFTAADTKSLLKLIDLQYRGNMVVDNMPAAQEMNAGPRFPKVMIGYPLGVPSKLSLKGKALVNNHLHFTIQYYVPDIHGENNEETYRIVGFYVRAHSITHTVDECNPQKPFSPSQHEPLEADSPSIFFSYSVSWVEEPNIVWATRWDVYLQGGENDDRIHWFSIINSSVVVLFLAAIVAMILARTLHKDFNRYNNPENEKEAQDESGWKMVHGDVFRPPEHPVLLAVVAGSGVQMVSMMVVTLVVACLGFLSLSNRGALLSSMILLFVLAGSFGGYTTARLLKLFKRQAWLNVSYVAFLLPAVCMIIYLGLNTITWVKHASSAIPFTTLLVLFALWLCVSVPLVLVGAAIGYKRPAMEMPCRVHLMPRLIPPRPWHLSSLAVFPAAGVLPFGAAFIELVFILSSFWQGRVYYVFGFLGLVFVIVCVTCTEVSIFMTYRFLTNNDYEWWWKSFLMTAFSGVYLFGYSLYYLFAILTIRQPTSMALYIGYMFWASLLFALFTGTIGFYASFAFVRKIYGSIKID